MRLREVKTGAALSSRVPLPTHSPQLRTYGNHNIRYPFNLKEEYFGYASNGYVADHREQAEAIIECTLCKVRLETLNEA